MKKEIQCKRCHEWWYSSEIKQDLCPNCYDYFKQLKQQLEEKDEQIKKRVMVYEKQFIEQTDEIYSLKQQLAEKDKQIVELEEENKVGEFWHSAYKGKQLDYDMVYTELRKCLEELEKHKQSQTQLAIQKLEKVKELLLDEYKKYPIVYDKTNDIVAGALDRDKVNEIIDQQIKELKGEKANG